MISKVPWGNVYGRSPDGSYTGSKAFLQPPVATPHEGAVKPPPRPMSVTKLYSRHCGGTGTYVYRPMDAQHDPNSISNQQ